MQTLLKILQISPMPSTISNGELPFHMACEVAAHVSILDTLLKKNQNSIKVRSKNTTNNTALHLLSDRNGISSNTKDSKKAVKLFVRKTIMHM